MEILTSHCKDLLLNNQYNGKKEGFFPGSPVHVGECKQGWVTNSYALQMQLVVVVESTHGRYEKLINAVIGD